MSSEEGKINIDDDMWSWATRDPILSETERALRDLFVTEYLVDYNEVKAAQRCGFQMGFAQDYAKKFLSESYVQKRIQDITHANVDEKKMDQFDKETVRSVLRREMQNQMGTAAARVAAAAKMAAILGMDKPVEVNNNHSHKGGVLVVPGISSINDWEAAAQASQTQLVSDARH